VPASGIVPTRPLHFNAAGRGGNPPRRYAQWLSAMNNREVIKIMIEF
jgi:hypothetical protein